MNDLQLVVVIGLVIAAYIAFFAIKSLPKHGTTPTAQRLNEIDRPKNSNGNY